MRGSLEGAAHGASVVFLLEMERWMGVSVNGGPFIRAAVALPPAVRPWACLKRQGDGVTLRELPPVQTRSPSAPNSACPATFLPLC